MKPTVTRERSRPRSDSPSVSVDDESLTYGGFKTQDEVGQRSRNQTLRIRLTAYGQPTITSRR